MCNSTRSAPACARATASCGSGWRSIPRPSSSPALALGARTQQTAHTLVHGLRAALAAGCTPVITTDGLRLYFYALTAHFGSWVTAGRRRCWQVDPRLLYGQLHKRYRRRRLVRIRYQMGCGSRHALQATLRALGWSGRLQTAFVERLNLTVRQSVAALTRRTWATAQTADGLQHQVEWWRAYYHFVRPIAACGSTAGPCTPAMAAGLTAQRWTVAELLGYPCARATQPRHLTAPPGPRTGLKTALWPPQTHLCPSAGTADLLLLLSERTTGARRGAPRVCYALSVLSMVGSGYEQKTLSE